jgi:hypothetical protein
MRIGQLNSLMVFGMVLVSCAETCAQPLVPHTESIESLVTNADLVFVAKLEGLKAAVQPNERGGWDGTIAVEETLKQDPASRHEPYTKLSMSFSYPVQVLTEWKVRGNRLLVAYDELAPDRTTVLELDPATLEAMTADMTLVRDPEVVLRTARETIRRLPAGVRRLYTFDLQVPRKIVAGTRWEPYYGTGGHLRLSVPVDSRLEARALESVRSANPQLRYEGVRALVFFPSDEHQSIVRPLLNDAGVTYNGPAPDESGEEYVYGVRSAAYETLKAWGVEVEKPVVREVRKKE